jgi:dolichol kinase
MAVFSLLAITMTLALLPGSTLSPNSAVPPAPTLIAMSAVGMLVATTAEALSPAGTDNLSVPLLTGPALWLIALVFG